MVHVLTSTEKCISAVERTLAHTRRFCARCEQGLDGAVPHIEHTTFMQLLQEAPRSRCYENVFFPSAAMALAQELVLTQFNRGSF